MRQLLFDYVHDTCKQHILSWFLFAFWLVIAALGAVAIIGGVKPPA